MIKLLKKATIASLLTLCAALPTHAAGPYDGIYVNLANAGSYLSLHTSGSTVVATIYGIISSSGIVMTSVLGNVTPRQINTWELYQGTISGSSAVLSGQTLFNACNLSVNVSFTSTGGTAYVTDASNTLVGDASRINCAALEGAYPNGISYRKIF